VVVAEEAVWVSDPGVAVVRRVDVLSRTEDQWKADGPDLAVTPGGTVWATSDTRLLGLGGPQVRGPRRNLHELKTELICLFVDLSCRPTRGQRRQPPCPSGRTWGRITSTVPL
jgi:hypothetical protein